jgi:UDP-glucose 4-epimerase
LGKVLVTGGCGFIGSHIVDLLLKKNYEVVIVDNLRTGKLDNINTEEVTFYDLDINSSNLEKVFKENSISYIIHQAAQVSVAESVKNMMEDLQINIVGTINLINFAKKYNTEKIIFASSAAVYGTPTYLPLDELHPVNPMSPYGLSKQAAESYLRISNELYGIKYTILRYANVYGPRQDAKGEGGVVAIFADKLKQKIVPEIHGDGTQTRDFIFVKDVAAANVACLTEGDNNTYNISTGTTISINELYKKMADIAKFEKGAIYVEARQADIKHSLLSNEKAIRELNWKPSVSLEVGLTELFHG